MHLSYPSCRSDIEDARVRISDACFPYGHEYLGNVSSSTAGQGCGRALPLQAPGLGQVVAKARAWEAHAAAGRSTALPPHPRCPAGPAPGHHAADRPHLHHLSTGGGPGLAGRLPLHGGQLRSCRCAFGIRHPHPSNPLFPGHVAVTGDGARGPRRHRQDGDDQGPGARAGRAVLRLQLLRPDGLQGHGQDLQGHGAVGPVGLHG